MDLDVACVAKQSGATLISTVIAGPGTKPAMRAKVGSPRREPGEKIAVARAAGVGTASPNQDKILNEALLWMRDAWDSQLTLSTTKGPLAFLVSH